MQCVMWRDYNVIPLEKGTYYKYKKLQGPDFFLYRIYRYYTTLFRYVVSWLHKADFIMSIVAQVSDVALGPLV